jgi:hypothetical protein
MHAHRRASSIREHGDKAFIYNLNDQVERRAATDVDEQEVANRRVRSNAGLGCMFASTSNHGTNQRTQYCRSCD